MQTFFEYVRELRRGKAPRGPLLTYKRVKKSVEEGMIEYYRASEL